MPVAVSGTKDNRDASLGEAFLFHGGDFVLFEVR